MQLEGAFFGIWDYHEVLGYAPVTSTALMHLPSSQGIDQTFGESNWRSIL